MTPAKLDRANELVREMRSLSAAREDRWYVEQLDGLLSKDTLDRVIQLVDQDIEDTLAAMKREFELL